MSENVHPLSHVSNKNDAFLKSFGKPTKDVLSSSTRAGAVRTMEYSSGDIDGAIDVVLSIVVNAITDLDEPQAQRKIQGLLEGWNRFLIKKSRSPLFIDEKKAIELVRPQVESRIEANGGNSSESAINRESMLLARTVIASQKEALSQWVWYLTQKDVSGKWYYPPRFQALMFKTITNRSSNTINPVLPLDSDVLGRLKDWVLPYLGDINMSDNSYKDQKEKLQSFGDHYVSTLAELEIERKALLDSADVKNGEWIIYGPNQIKEVMEICKKTPLCLRYEAYAASYVSAGKRLRMWVTKTTSGVKIPRIVISYSTKDGKKYIEEMRGVDGPNQDLEPISDLADIAEKECSIYANGNGYINRAKSVREFSRLKRKLQLQKLHPKDPIHRFTKEDLMYIYGFNVSNKGFGRSERTDELREGRNTIEDLEHILEVDGIKPVIAISPASLIKAVESGKKVDVYIGEINMYFGGDLDWTDADWEITSEDVKKYYKYLWKIPRIFNCNIFNLQRLEKTEVKTISLSSTTLPEVETSLRSCKLYSEVRKYRDRMFQMNVVTDSDYSKSRRVILIPAYNRTFGEIVRMANGIGLSYCDPDIPERLCANFVNQNEILDNDFRIPVTRRPLPRREFILRTKRGRLSVDAEVPSDLNRRFYADLYNPVFVFMPE